MDHHLHLAGRAVCVYDGEHLDCAPFENYRLFDLCCLPGASFLHYDNLMEICFVHDHEAEASRAAYAVTAGPPLGSKNFLGGDLCLCCDFCGISCFCRLQTACYRCLYSKSLLTLTFSCPCSLLANFVLGIDSKID